MGGSGGQSGCERRIEVFVKIQKKRFFLGGVGGSSYSTFRDMAFTKFHPLVCQRAVI